MKCEPIRHHYIPQFILRNFCFDGKHHLNYYDKRTGQCSVKEPRDIFMVRNLYRDEINNEDVPTKIETDLSHFEREASELIREKFLCESSVLLSAEENEMLKLFFAIMAFRANITGQLFENGLSKQGRRFYDHWQGDGNLLDLWKRNLGYVVNCRSLDEVLAHPGIDEPIKVFMCRDTFGYFDKYFCIAEVCGVHEFIIGDIYPVIVTGELPNGLPLQMYGIYPISPRRVILFANNGVIGAPPSELKIGASLFIPPKVLAGGKGIQQRVRRIYDREVDTLNRMIFENAEEGVVYQKHTAILTESKETQL